MPANHLDNRSPSFLRRYAEWLYEGISTHGPRDQWRRRYRFPATFLMAFLGYIFAAGTFKQHIPIQQRLPMATTAMSLLCGATMPYFGWILGRWKLYVAISISVFGAAAFAAFAIASQNQ